MDLIDREELLKRFELTSQANGNAIRYEIKCAPTVDAEPVRHGKWIEWNGMDIPENHGRHKCSICGEFAIKPKYGEEILTKRCNNCDAKMDGE